MNEARPPKPDWAARIAQIEWFHRIELAPGLVTDGKIDPRPRLPGLRLPDDLSGRTLLDIGAWDGFFSFEMERRGAAVTALDSFGWSGDGWGSRAGFACAREALGSTVEAVEMEVLDLSPDAIGTFDIVLFLNVLYHMLPARLRDGYRRISRYGIVLIFAMVFFFNDAFRILLSPVYFLMNAAQAFVQLWA